MQMHFSILAYDDVKCSKCLKFHKWNEGKGWHRQHCPVCVAEYKRQYRADNTDAIRERDRQYYAANADAKRKYWRQWAAANPDAIREYSRKYRAANADAKRERDRKYRATNADAIREHNRQYRADNPEVYRRGTRNRRARKHNAVCIHGPGCFDRAAKQMPQRCTYCGTEQDIVADHYNPLANGGLDCKDNLQPACRSCNARKQDTDPIVFAQRELGRLF